MYKLAVCNYGSYNQTFDLKVRHCDLYFMIYEFELYSNVFWCLNISI